MELHNGVALNMIENEAYGCIGPAVDLENFGLTGGAGPYRMNPELFDCMEQLLAAHQ